LRAAQGIRISSWAALTSPALATARVYSGCFASPMMKSDFLESSNFTQQ